MGFFETLDQKEIPTWNSNIFQTTLGANCQWLVPSTSSAQSHTKHFIASPMCHSMNTSRWLSSDLRRWVVRLIALFVWRSVLVTSRRAAFLTCARHCNCQISGYLVDTVTFIQIWRSNKNKNRMLANLKRKNEELWRILDLSIWSPNFGSIRTRSSTKQEVHLKLRRKVFPNFYQSFFISPFWLNQNPVMQRLHNYLDKGGLRMVSFFGSLQVSLPAFLKFLRRTSKNFPSN